MLEIKGAADTQYDRMGLAEAKLRDQLMQARLEEMGAEADSEAVVARGVDFADENYSRLLLQAYIDTFDEDPRILLEDESGTSPVQLVTGLGRRLVETVQDVIVFGTDPIGRTRSVLRDMVKTPESLPLLLEKTKQRLVEHTAVEQVELQVLARERANRIKGHLIDSGKVPGEQVFMVEPEIGRTSGGDSLQMHLSLTGR